MTQVYKENSELWKEGVGAVHILFHLSKNWKIISPLLHQIISKNLNRLHLQSPDLYCYPIMDCNVWYSCGSFLVNYYTSHGVNGEKDKSFFALVSKFGVFNNN